MKFTHVIAACLLLTSLSAQIPTPTLRNEAYGRHVKQRFDFYRSEGPSAPTPAVIFLHPGGWTAGDKAQIADYGTLLNECLDAGVSVFAVNYRFCQDSYSIVPKPVVPLQAPTFDCIRALQFIRANADRYNIDKTKIAGYGSSAGGCSALLLATRDDYADPANANPIYRESSRLLCVAASSTQTHLDPLLAIEQTPNACYGGHAFGYWDYRNLATRDTCFPQFLAAREATLSKIVYYSPLYQVTPDDPPICLIYPTPPNYGAPSDNPTHSPNYAIPMLKACTEAGVRCEFSYPGSGSPYTSPHIFLLEYLLAP